MLPLGAWVLTTVAALLLDPRGLVKHSRQFIAYLFLAVLVSGLAFFFNADNFGLGLLGEQVGGRISEYIARYPIQLPNSSVIIVATWARFAVLGAAFALTVHPKTARLLGDMVSFILKTILLVGIFFVQLIKSISDKFRKRQIEHQKLTAEDLKQDLLDSYERRHIFSGNSVENGISEESSYPDERGRIADTRSWTPPPAGELQSYGDRSSLSSLTPLLQEHNVPLPYTLRQPRMRREDIRQTDDSTDFADQSNYFNNAGPPLESGFTRASSRDVPGLNTSFDRVNNPENVPYASQPEGMDVSNVPDSGKYSNLSSNSPGEQGMPSPPPSSLSGFDYSDLHYPDAQTGVDSRHQNAETKVDPRQRQQTSFAEHILKKTDTITVSSDAQGADTERFTPLSIASRLLSKQEQASQSAAGQMLLPLPDRTLLQPPPPNNVSTEDAHEVGLHIEESLRQHGVDVKVAQAFVGPTITKYGLVPGWRRGGQASGRVRVGDILNREKDLALALASPSIRFEPVVPGESMIGLEVPNIRPSPVTLRSVIDTPEWAAHEQTAALPFPIGIGSRGEPVFADLASMPHLLVAGATGSGKSVCINSIVAGLLLTRTPYQTRMVMIDPKRVELTPYQGIPHLYTPVVVEPKNALLALRVLVQEMSDRLEILSHSGVRNISAYNMKNSTPMPYIVVIIDELADLMLTASNEVERLLVRLSQLARATGVHMILATQRPSVDVVTGLIKANFPSRICFAVTSQVDSRTILDGVGGEKLIGRGDMLYMTANAAKPTRVQGAFLSDTEIESLVTQWKRFHPPGLSQMDLGITDNSVSGPQQSLKNNERMDDGDVLFSKAVELAASQKTLSTSLLQRRLKIGYPRAARLMEELEEAEIVGHGQQGKPRQVLISRRVQ